MKKVLLITLAGLGVTTILLLYHKHSFSVLLRLERMKQVAKKTNMVLNIYKKEKPEVAIDNLQNVVSVFENELRVNDKKDPKILFRNNCINSLFDYKRQLLLNRKTIKLELAGYYARIGLKYSEIGNDDQATAYFNKAISILSKLSIQFNTINDVKNWIEESDKNI